VGLAVGEVVIVYDECHLSSFWKLDSIPELIVERDGQARWAVVRIPHKDSHFTLLNHPLQLLYSFEITQSPNVDASPR